MHDQIKFCSCSQLIENFVVAFYHQNTLDFLERTKISFKTKQIFVLFFSANNRIPLWNRQTWMPKNFGGLVFYRRLENFTKILPSPQFFEFHAFTDRVTIVRYLCQFITIWNKSKLVLVKLDGDSSMKWNSIRPHFGWRFSLTFSACAKIEGTPPCAFAWICIFMYVCVVHCSVHWQLAQRIIQTCFSTLT